MLLESFLRDLFALNPFVAKILNIPKHNLMHTLQCYNNYNILFHNTFVLYYLNTNALSWVFLCFYSNTVYYYTVIHGRFFLLF